MTKVISSQTSDKKYFLTIEEQGAAVDCSCPDHQFRQHACKHMREYHKELNRVTIFNLLRLRFDCRLNGDEVTHRNNFELALGY